MDPPTKTPLTASGLPPLTGVKLILAALVASAANFLVLLDTTIANVSIPNIAASLGASPHEGIWVLTSYAVADAISVCLTGWLTARLGLARVTSYTIIGFGIASMMCGLSTSLGMLVFFRIVQGIFGGPLIALSQIILLSVFPRDKMPTALAIWSTGTTLAPVSGPILGGYICDTWSWPWIFLINVPIAAFAAFVTWRLLRRRDAPPKRGPVDVVGLGLMVTWIGATQFVLDRAPDLDWFESGLILAATIIAVVGFCAFLIWELTEPTPIVNLRVFRDHAFAAGMFNIFLGAGAFYASLVLSPLWLQTNMGYTATWAGLMAAPMGLTMMVSTPGITALMRRYDARILASIPMVVLAITYFWRAHFSSDVTMEMIILANIVLGVAMPMFALPTIALSLSTLPPQDMASANGAIAFARTISIAFATSLVTTHWRDGATINRTAIVDRLNGPHGLSEISATGIPPDKALWAMDGLVQNQAVMMATNDTYLMMGAVVFVLAFTIWIAPKAKTGRS